MTETHENRKQLNNLFKDILKNQYDRGVRIGALSVSKVVLDKLNDGSKSLMTRIDEVKRFCATPLKNVSMQINQTTEADEHIEKRDKN